MPGFEKHIEQAKSNLGMASYLASGNVYPDWFITSCFYSAVHFVEAIVHKEKPIKCELSDGNEYESQDACHCVDFKSLDRRECRAMKSAHWYRSKIIEANSDLFGNVFEDAYKNLYELSHLSRYDCYEDCHLEHTLVRENIAVITDHINHHYRIESSL